jgi:hypothetical protein
MRDDKGKTTFFTFNNGAREESRKRNHEIVQAMPVKMHVSILKIILGTLILSNVICVYCYIATGHSFSSIMSLIGVSAVIDTILMIWFIPEYDN